MALPPHLADLESRLASRFAEAVAEFRRAVEAQLRRDSDRWLSGIADVPAPAAADWLAASDLGTLDLAPRQAASRDALDRIAATLRSLDLASSQAEALDALLDGALAWCDRVALVLARDQGLTGWGDRGFGDAGPAGREVEWDTTLRERLLASRGCLRIESEAAADALAQFGCEADGDAVVVPLVLRDRIAALLWADRREGAPELAPLQILVHAAGQRLELQALSDRAFSPTLWEGAEAPGEPLPLWSVLTPAAPAPVEEAVEEELVAEEPEAGARAEVEMESEELGAGMWQAEPPDSTFVETADEAVAEAPEVDAGLAAEEPAAPLSFVEVGEDAAALGEVAPPEAAEEPPPVEPEAEPQPDFEMESAAAVEEVEEAERWEPEPEPEPETAGTDDEDAGESAATGAVEIAAAEREATRIDELGTVRMPLPAIESFERPHEETTAPQPVAEAAAPESPAGTQEVEAPPPVESDISEDATQLSMRRPEIPEAPVPPPPPPPAPPPEEHPMDRTGSRFGRSTEVAPPPDVSGPGLAFLAGRAGGRASSDPAHDEAKRLARLLISEIRLYNEEQVLEGRRNRDLYHRLKEDIDRSRQIYEERVDTAVRGEVDYFQQELVRSLAGGDPRALGI